MDISVGLTLRFLYSQAPGSREFACQIVPECSLDLLRVDGHLCHLASWDKPHIFDHSLPQYRPLQQGSCGTLRKVDPVPYRKPRQFTASPVRVFHNQSMSGSSSIQFRVLPALTHCGQSSVETGTATLEPSSRCVSELMPMSGAISVGLASRNSFWSLEVRAVVNSLIGLPSTVEDLCPECAALRFWGITFYDKWRRGFQSVRTGLGRGDCNWLGVKSATRRSGAESSRSRASGSSLCLRSIRPCRTSTGPRTSFLTSWIRFARSGLAKRERRRPAP